MSVVVTVRESLDMFVVKDSVLSIGVAKYVVCLCRGVMNVVRSV